MASPDRSFEPDQESKEVPVPGPGEERGARGSDRAPKSTESVRALGLGAENAVRSTSPRGAGVVALEVSSVNAMAWSGGCRKSPTTSPGTSGRTGSGRNGAAAIPRGWIPDSDQRRRTVVWLIPNRRARSRELVRGDPVPEIAPEARRISRTRVSGIPPVRGARVRASSIP